MGVRQLTPPVCSDTNDPIQVAAIKGYENTNSVSLNMWEEVYPDSLLIALTDTFTTGSFFKVLSRPLPIFAGRS